MLIQNSQCPNCGAAIHVSEGVLLLSCTYCSSVLTVERNDGLPVLKRIEKLEKTIQDSSTQTQGQIRDSTQATATEYHRLKVSQDLRDVRSRLFAVQTEIRTVERAVPTEVSRQQLSDLRRQEKSLKDEEALLQAALQPPVVQADRVRGASTAGSTMARVWETGVGWAVLAFFGVVVLLQNALSVPPGDDLIGVIFLAALAAVLTFWLLHDQKQPQAGK